MKSSNLSFETSRNVMFNMINTQDCERIHETALELLQDRGMVFQSDEARAILNDHGCWLDDEGYTHFPKNLILDAISSSPSEYVFHGRTDDDDLPLLKNRVYGCTSGEALYTYDLETDERRFITKQDTVNMIRVVDALKNTHVYNRIGTPSNVPIESADLHNAEIAFTFTSKPIHLVSKDPWATKKIIEMAEIAAAGPNNPKAKEILKNRPNCTFNYMPICPLQVPDHLCDNAILTAKAGLPANVISVVQVGGVSPVSLAGNLVLHNAEVLALITFLQCIQKGLPLCYGGTPTSMDLRKGICLFGSPEALILNSAVSNMAQFYNLPSYITGGKNDAMQRDMQSGSERAMTKMLTALSGSTVLSGSGLMEGGMVADIPTLLFDDEITDSILRACRGVAVDTENLSLELIKEMGAFGIYLTHESTYEKMHELSDYKVLNRYTNETWNSAGSPTVIDNGKKLAKEILQNHKQKNSLEKEKIMAIRQVLIDAEEELGHASFWEGKEHLRFCNDGLDF